MTTPDGRLVLAAPRKHGDGFAAALILAEVSVSTILGGGGQGANLGVLALATGNLQKQNKELVRTPRKQVVALVTSDAHVVLLDSNLKLKWKNKLPVSPDVHLEDVSIVITPHSPTDKDQGMVLVSMRRVGGIAEDVEADDYIDVEDRVEELRENDRHAHGRTKGERLEEVDANPNLAAQHVTYFAYSGQSGDVVWEHDSGDFHKDLSYLKETMVSTLHSSRGEAKLQEGVHYGEHSCRDYRESILGSLPHRYVSMSEVCMRVRSSAIIYRLILVCSECSGGTILMIVPCVWLITIDIRNIMEPRSKNWPYKAKEVRETPVKNHQLFTISGKKMYVH